MPAITRKDVWLWSEVKGEQTCYYLVREVAEVLGVDYDTLVTRLLFKAGACLHATKPDEKVEELYVYRLLLNRIGPGWAYRQACRRVRERCNPIDANTVQWPNCFL